MKKRCENGSALVAVLCLLLTGGIITTAVLALSKTGTFTVYAHLERQKSMFVAEGVATRVQYLYAADLHLHTSEKLGETDYTEYDYDRFLCDEMVRCGIFPEIFFCSLLGGFHLEMHVVVDADG